MITCRECIERMLPDDPRIRSGRYHMCSCDYCDKPEYYRELEARETEPQVIEHIHRTSDMGKKEFDLLQQTALKVDYLQGRINELLDRGKRQPEKHKLDITNTGEG